MVGTKVITIKSNIERVIARRINICDRYAMELIGRLCDNFFYVYFF